MGHNEPLRRTVTVRGSYLKCAMPHRKLCKVSDIENPGSKGFCVDIPSGTLQLFVVKKNLEVFGYQNVCPHTGVGLDWVPHRFLDVNESLIICATHGALFEIHSGLCVSGPCWGEKLTPVPIEIIDDEIFLVGT